MCICVCICANNMQILGFGGVGGVRSGGGDTIGGGGGGCGGPGTGLTEFNHHFNHHDPNEFEPEIHESME